MSTTSATNNVAIVNMRKRSGSGSTPTTPTTTASGATGTTPATPSSSTPGVPATPPPSSISSTPRSLGKAALKEKIVQMYDVMFRHNEDPEKVFGSAFWSEFFLLRPKIVVMEEIINKLSGEAVMQCKTNINALFGNCVENLSEDHHIRVVYALQTLCGLVKAVIKKVNTSGYDLVNLLIGFEEAEIRMQSLIAHVTE